MSKPTSQGREIAGKATDHIAKEVAPDLCFEPGCAAPKPFANEVGSDKLAAGQTVLTLINGQPIWTQHGELGPPSERTHTGTVGGQRSGTYLHQAAPTSWSGAVAAEGGGVVLAQHPTTQNRGNAVGRVLPREGDSTASATSASTNALLAIDCGPKCKKCLPDQSKWSHEDKVAKMKEAKQFTDPKVNPKAPGYAPGDAQNPEYFNKTAETFNQLASALQVDVLWIHGFCGKESGWLDVENDWLHNPFGMTAGGKDNLGYDSLQQAAAHWLCANGGKVKGSKTYEEFLSNLKGYNSVNPDYYAFKPYQDLIKTVNRRYGKHGYEHQEVGDGTFLLVKKPPGGG